MATARSEGGQEKDSAFLRINNTPVYFQEDWDTGIGGGLWSTGLAFARYLEHHPQHALSSLDALHKTNKLSLLELGSGNGFLAICMLALMPRYLERLCHYRCRVASRPD